MLEYDTSRGQRTKNNLPFFSLSEEETEESSEEEIEESSSDKLSSDESFSTCYNKKIMNMLEGMNEVDDNDQTTTYSSS